MVFWGGDSIPHDPHDQDIQGVVQTMNKTTDLVAEKLKGTKIYTTIGNHDTYPQDIIKMKIPKENPAIN